jgi:hypothetical protein
MTYTDVEGAWSSKWAIKAYDNKLHHFQVAFETGMGNYRPMGQTMSGSYDRGSLLTVQLANGTSYPALQGAGSCTDAGGTPIPDCRLYAKQ